MRCLHCGKRLSLLRKLQDAEFCSDEHKLAFQQQQSDLALSRLMESQKRIDRPEPSAQKQSRTARKPAAGREAAPESPPQAPLAALRNEPSNVKPSLHVDPQPLAARLLRELPPHEPRLGRPAPARKLQKIPLMRLDLARRVRVRAGERLRPRRIIYAPRLGRLAQGAGFGKPGLAALAAGEPVQARGMDRTLGIFPLPSFTTGARAGQAGLRLEAWEPGRCGPLRILPGTRESAAAAVRALATAPASLPPLPVLPSDTGRPARQPLRPAAEPATEPALAEALFAPPAGRALPAASVLLSNPGRPAWRPLRPVYQPLRPAAEPATEPALAERLFALPAGCTLPAAPAAPRAIPLTRTGRAARVIAWPMRSAAPRSRQLATANRLALLHWQALRPAAGFESWKYLPLLVHAPASYPTSSRSVLPGLASADVEPLAAGRGAPMASALPRLAVTPLPAAAPGRTAPPSLAPPSAGERSLPQSARLAALPLSSGAASASRPVDVPTHTGAFDTEAALPGAAISRGAKLEPAPVHGLCGMPPAPPLRCAEGPGVDPSPLRPARLAAALPRSSGVPIENSDASTPPIMTPAAEPLPRWLRPEPRQWLPTGPPAAPPARDMGPGSSLPGTLPVGPVDEVAPPLFPRLLPLLSGRARATAPAPPAFTVTPTWPEAGAIPAFPRSRLRTDRPDGSGPRHERPLPAGPGWRVPGLTGAARFWRHAPADLKWIGIGLPLVLLLVLYSALPSGPASPSERAAAGLPSTSDGVRTSLTSGLSGVQAAIMRRAAINLTDDFRSGLSAWAGPGDWARSWTYDEAGFLVPGALGLYSPTLPLADYTFEFLGHIERRSLNWVIRARDTRNYYAMRLVISSQGPMPKASIVRYTVIDGKEGPATTLPLPMAVNPNLLFRIRVDAKGSAFTTWMSGQVVDNFTDTRLARGGIGFFSPKGDQSRLRWVEVSHQYDFLGRLCALLAPYSVQAEGREAE